MAVARRPLRASGGNEEDASAQPAEEPAAEEQMEETDITSLVEEAEKFKAKTSRKRTKVRLKM